MTARRIGPKHDLHANSPDGLGQPGQVQPKSSLVVDEYVAEGSGLLDLIRARHRNLDRQGFRTDEILDLATTFGPDIIDIIQDDTSVLDEPVDIDENDADFWQAVGEREFPARDSSELILGSYSKYLTLDHLQAMNGNRAKLDAIRVFIEELEQFGSLAVPTIRFLVEAHIQSRSPRSTTAIDFINVMGEHFGYQSGFINQAVRSLHTAFPGELNSALHWLSHGAMALEFLAGDNSKITRLDRLTLLIIVKKHNKLRAGKSTLSVLETMARVLGMEALREFLTRQQGSEASYTSATLTKLIPFIQFFTHKKRRKKNIFDEASQLLAFINCFPKRQTRTIFEDYARTGRFDVMANFYTRYQIFIKSGYQVESVTTAMDFFRNDEILDHEPTFYEIMALNKLCCDALIGSNRTKRTTIFEDELTYEPYIKLALAATGSVTLSWFVATMQGEQGFASSTFNSRVATFYQILSLPYARLQCQQLSLGAFRRLAQALLLDHHRANENFYTVVTGKGNIITNAAIIAGTVLIEKRVTDPDLFQTLMQELKNPGQSLALWDQELAAFEARPILDIATFTRFSMVQQLALYFYVISKQPRGLANEMNLSVKGFQYCLQLEWGILLKRGGGTLPLWKLSTHILASSCRGSHAYDILAALLRKHDAGFVPAELLLDIYDKIFSASSGNQGVFLTNVTNGKTYDDILAATELLDAGIDLDGDDFQQYRGMSDRQVKLKTLVSRTTELVHGHAVKEDLDVFELLAIRLALRTKNLSVAQIKRIVTQAKIAPQNPRIGQLKPETFSVTLAESVHAKVHKGIVSDYVEPIRKIIDLPCLAKWLRALIKNYRTEGLKLIRGDILKFFGWNGTDPLDLGAEAAKVTEANALHLLSTILEALSRHPVNAKGMKSLIPLLIAQTWHQPVIDHLKPAISVFDVKAPADVLIDAIGALHEFYTDHLPDTVRDSIGDSEHMGRFLTQAGQRMAKQLEQVQTRSLGKVDLILVPSRTALDAFFGYVAQDCLASEQYSLAALQDDCFVPYRIIVDSQWMGMVFTLTVWEGDKKILLVPGIEPRTELNMDVDEFLNGLEQALFLTALAHGYAMVLIPADGSAQSSRTATVQPKIRARYTKNYSTKIAHGFPLNTSGGYYAKHSAFKVIHDMSQYKRISGGSGDPLPVHTEKIKTKPEDHAGNLAPGIHTIPKAFLVNHGHPLTAQMVRSPTQHKGSSNNPDHASVRNPPPLTPPAGRGTYLASSSLEVPLPQGGIRGGGLQRGIVFKGAHKFRPRVRTNLLSSSRSFTLRATHRSGRL